MTNSEFYTVEQVAELLRVHWQTILNYIKNGRLNAVKLGKGYRISKDALEAFIKENQTEVLAEQYTDIIVNPLDLLDKYKIEDRRFNTHTDIQYEHLVNFSKTKDLPIHRWFYFVEGYSPKLVENIINHLGIELKPTTLLFDPFSGSGTTLLTGKSMGIKSSGFEINPFSAFMIEVKTRNYSGEQVKKLLKFTIPQYESIPDIYDKYELKIINNLFDKVVLEQIELLKIEINKEKDEKVRKLLYLALLTTLPIVSNYRKGGNGLKRKRVMKSTDVFSEFAVKLQEIRQDLNVSGNGLEPIIINDSCLNICKYSIPQIDISIFSPPYANCFDPFEVYKTELWVGEFVKSYKELAEKRKMALTSNLNANLKKEFDNSHRTSLLDDIITYLSKKELWDKRIPKMLDTYFYDMHIVLNELYSKTKQGGYCVIVVGNSAYGYLAIPTDIILGQLGEKVGFNVEEIIVARRNETSSQQHAKLGDYVSYLRESLIVLKK